jgi:hypothetical protein
MVSSANQFLTPYLACPWPVRKTRLPATREHSTQASSEHNPATIAAMAPPAHNNSTEPPALTNASTASVRRNLFSSHLSRRPASNTAHAFTNDLQILQSTSQAETRPNSPSHAIYHNAITNDSKIMGDDIILRDDQGRPTLPSIPVLPPHLRLSPSSSEQHVGDADDPDYASQLELEDAMREKEDKERIEKSLVEMMYRSRSRAHGHATRHGAAGSAGPSRSLGPENEELLALVQASLRKKVSSLEEDRWMFQGERTVR